MLEVVVVGGYYMLMVGLFGVGKLMLVVWLVGFLLLLIDDEVLILVVLLFVSWFGFLFV